MRILIDNGNTPAAPRPYIGHYGRLRKAYLEQYRPDLYTAQYALTMGMDGGEAGCTDAIYHNIDTIREALS